MAKGINSSNFQSVTDKAEAGNANAQLALGLTYESGSPYIKQDYQKAVEWLSKAAEQGNALAQHTLADIFAEGRGTLKNYSKAIELYRKAADHDDVRAIVKLGDMYLEGLGTGRNYSEALNHFNKAAAAGFYLAYMKLGQMYFHGWGIPRDSLVAARWLFKGVAVMIFAHPFLFIKHAIRLMMDRIKIDE
jgi:uncharacterized protein